MRHPLPWLEGAGWGRQIFCEKSLSSSRSARKRGPGAVHDPAVALVPADLADYHPEKVELTMQDHIYKLLDLVGSSETSIEDAIQKAIQRANETIRNLRWFEVVQIRGQINDGQVQHYQVTLKVGFTMEAASEES
jgi:flavin-binding protein dodecin